MASQSQVQPGVSQDVGSVVVTPLLDKIREPDRHVGQVGIEEVEGDHLVCPPQLIASYDGDVSHVAAETSAGAGPSGGLLGPTTGGVLPDRLKQPVARDAADILDPGQQRVLRGACVHLTAPRGRRRARRPSA
jgi:hypothetical protein